MADRYLLESGSPDGYLLEDGSGVLLLEAGVFWDPIDGFNKNRFLTLSNSNLTSTSDNQGLWESVRANLPTAVSSFRFEVSLVTGSTPTNVTVGVENGLTDFSALNALPGSSNSNGVALSLGGTGWVILRSGGVVQGPFGSPAAASGQIVTVVGDKVAGTLAFYVNGTQIGVNETSVSFTNWYAYVSGKDAATSAGIGNFSGPFSFGSGSAYDGTVSSRTATLANTLSAVTLSSNGSLTSRIATLAKTLGVVSLSSNGKVAIQATLAKTLGAVTLSSNSKLAIHATLANTLGAVTSSSSAKLKINGTLSNTLGVLTLSSAAKLKINGTLAKTLGVLSLSSQGHINLSGSLNKTLGVLTGSATGKLLIQGSLTRILGTLTSASLGRLLIRGSVNTTLSALTGTETGQLLIKGSLSGTLSPILLTSTGHLVVNFVLGSLDKTLSGLTLSSTIKLHERMIVRPIGDFQTSIQSQIRQARLPKARTTSFKIRQS